MSRCPNEASGAGALVLAVAWRWVDGLPGQVGLCPGKAAARERQERRQRKERSPSTHWSLFPLSLSWKESGRGHKTVQLGCLSLASILGRQGWRVHLCTCCCPRTNSYHGWAEGALIPGSPGSTTNGLGTEFLLFSSFASHKHQEGGSAVASNLKPSCPMRLP